MNTPEAPSEMQLYLLGKADIPAMKEQLLSTVQRTKQKIDEIETKQFLRQSEDAQISEQNKQSLHSVLAKINTLTPVLQKLQKQNLQKHDVTRTILINTIKKQLKRFYQLIPLHLIKRIQNSDMQMAVRSVIKCDDAYEKNESERETREQDELKFETLFNSLSVYIETSPKSSFDESQLNDNNQEIKKLEEDQKVREEVIAIKQQQQEERKRYKIFITNENRSKQRSTVKTVGKILLCLSCAALGVLIVLGYIIYLILMAIGEL